MYKSRIERWGLKKNITMRDVPELAHQMQTEAARKSTAVTVRGREIPIVKAARYMNRNPTALLASHSNSSNTTTLRTSKPYAPAPRWLALPAEMCFPEEIIYLSCQFVAGCYENGTWCPERTDPGFFASRKANAWLNETTCGARHIEEGRYARAFKSLDTSFDQIKALLREPEPALFIYFYFAVLQLPEIISLRMRAYAAEMSAITLPASHPMNLIWSRLSRVGNQQLLAHAWSILHPYFCNLEGRFRYCEYGTLKFSVVFYSLMAQLDCVDLAMARSRLMGLGKSLQSGGYVDQALNAKIVVAMIHMQAQEYQDAATVLGEVAQDVDRCKEIAVARNTYQCLVFQLHKVKGTTEHALDAGNDLMRSCLLEYGPAHDRTLEAVGAVKAYLLEIGAVDEAKRLHHILESEEGLDSYLEEIEMA